MTSTSKLERLRCRQHVQRRDAERQRAGERHLALRKRRAGVGKH